MSFDALSGTVGSVTPDHGAGLPTSDSSSLDSTMPTPFDSRSSISFLRLPASEPGGPSVFAMTYSASYSGKVVFGPEFNVPVTATRVLFLPPSSFQPKVFQLFKATPITKTSDGEALNMETPIGRNTYRSLYAGNNHNNLVELEKLSLLGEASSSVFEVVDEHMSLNDQVMEVVDKLAAKTE